ncbi:hypothetical protein ACQJBY_006079 [Aegilops geniculata]
MLSPPLPQAARLYSSCPFCHAHFASIVKLHLVTCFAQLTLSCTLIHALHSSLCHA